MNQQTLFAEPKPPAAPKAASPSKPPIKKLRLLSVPRFTRRPRGIVAQTRAALRPGNRLATLLGATLGSFVPLATWVLAHRELDASRPLKAAGFVVLLEGVLVGSRTHWLSLAALAVLAGINALATGAILSTEDS